MHCLACDVVLSDEEAAKKFDNWEEIANPEHRYIGLCRKCLGKSELNVYDEDLIDVQDVPDDDFEGDCV